MRRSILLLLFAAMQPALAQSPGVNGAAFYFTGEVDAKGIEPSATGKFGAMRVTIGVVTPGANCSLGAHLTAPHGGSILGQDTLWPLALAPGKSIVALDFFGPQIAREAPDTRLAISYLRLNCIIEGDKTRYTAEDKRTYPIPDLRPTDFDSPSFDFELVPQDPIRIAAGDFRNATIRMRFTGALGQPLQTTVEATDSRVHVITQPSTSIFVVYWREGHPLTVSIRTDPDIPPGDYSIRLTARTSKLSHYVDLTVIVDSDLTRRKQEAAAARAAALNKIRQAEPELPVPDVPKPSNNLAANFSTEATLRKIHAVLVLDRSGSMNARESCDFMKASATGFSRLFVDGRDWLSVISYAVTVQTVLPLTDQFRAEAPDRIAAIGCFGETNTGEALEIAQQELDRHPDPQAINAVILFTDGLPNVLTAKWPVTGPRQCAETKNGEVAASLRIESGMFVQAGSSEKEERLYNMPRASPTSCFGDRRMIGFQSIPEIDLHGIPLTGSRALLRFPDGPFAGKIRLDSRSNRENATANQVENAARRLRTDPSHPAFVYVIAFDDSPDADMAGPGGPLKNLVNESSSPSFQQNQPAGSVIVAKGPEEFWPAFQRIRKEIISHAVVQ